MSVTPSAQQRQLQIRRRLQHHKLTTGNILRIQHQNKSDPSSSDDGMTQPIMHHRVAAGLHLAHTKTIAHAGLLSESIEMQPLTSPPTPPVAPARGRHRSVDQEDSLKTTSTLSPRTISSDRDTLETNLSVTTRDDTFERDECSYKRSRSYHGKGFDRNSLSLVVVKFAVWSLAVL